jgi:hypothetical protein
MRTEDASKFNKELQYIDVIEAAELYAWAYCM